LLDRPSSSRGPRHRGQVAARLREIGGEPPLVDFIAWVRLGRPEPVWPDAVDSPASK